MQVNVKYDPGHWDRVLVANDVNVRPSYRMKKRANLRRCASDHFPADRLRRRIGAMPDLSVAG